MSQVKFDKISPIATQNWDHPWKQGSYTKIFKLKLCKSGNVLLIHVAYNIRSLVAAQPVFLGLTQLGLPSPFLLMATWLSISSPFVRLLSNFGPKFLGKRAKFWLGNKHMVFGELEPKTYPPRTKGLKYSSMFPQGERNLLMEPPICSRKHMVPQNWSPKLSCPRNKKGFKYRTKLP